MAERLFDRRFGRKSDPGRTDAPSVLTTEGLVKIYGKRTVVNGVGFEVRQGEVVGLLGPNGAGKTTSFRMTCGLIAANAGKVYLGENDVTSWPMYRRAREGRMGYLPQDRSVFGSLSTEKNLYLAMELLNIPRSKRKKKCEELLKKFNLWHVRKTIVGAGGTGGLSGGERRRLEIARALLSEPRILMLDEPFANVDPNTVTEIQKVIGELSAEGIAVLITDHQIEATMEIAQYCYVIYDGQVLCDGDPVSVLSHPQARQFYFGEKSQQQLENLMKKIRQHQGGYAAPDDEPPRRRERVWRVGENSDEVRLAESSASGRFRSRRNGDGNDRPPRPADEETIRPTGRSGKVSFMDDYFDGDDRPRRRKKP